MEKWIAAGAAVLIGLFVGAVASRVTSGYLGKPQRPEPLRATAAVVGQFVFSVCMAAGLITALGIVSPSNLEPIPGQLVNYLPKVMVAAIFLIVGRIAGAFVALTLGEAVKRVSGRPQPNVEAVARGAVTGGFAILALAQLGIDNTIIYILVGGIVLSLAFSFALLAGLGGQEVARNIAAGRSLRHQLVPGSIVGVGQVSGTVVELHPATVELERADGVHLHMPYSTMIRGTLEIHTDD